MKNRGIKKGLRRKAALFLRLILCPLFLCQWPEDRHPANKTEKLYHQHSGQHPDTVDGHIFFGGTSSGYKGLVVFVQGRKAHTEASGEKRKPKSPHAVNIERKRDRDSQQKIFGHMGQFPDRIMDSFYVIFLLDQSSSKASLADSTMISLTL